MNNALADLPGVKVIVDDILVYGEGEDFEAATKDHDRNVI